MGCARKAQCTVGTTRVRGAASGSARDDAGSDLRSACSRSRRAFLRPVSKAAQRQRAVLERGESGAGHVPLPSSSSSHADPYKESASSSHADEDDGDRRGGGEEEQMELEEEEELVEVVEVVVVVVGTQQ
jgi:hypothetical protein